MITAKELKEIIENIPDDEEVVLSIQPAPDNMEVGTFKLEKVSYTKIIFYRAIFPWRERVEKVNESRQQNNQQRR